MLYAASVMTVAIFALASGNVNAITGNEAHEYCRTRACTHKSAMSALPPKADIAG